MGSQASQPLPACMTFDPKIADRLRRQRKSGQAILEWRRSIGALLLRETLVRFGSSRLGYLWALIEPIAFIMVFFGLRSLIGSASPFGESLALFVLSGLVAARVVINLMSKIASAITANRAMLTYPVVQPLDTVLARCFLEIITSMMVISIVYAGLIMFVENTVIHDYIRFTLATLATIFLGASWGVLNAALAPIFPLWTTIMGLLKFPLFIGSGIFFIPSQFSPFVQSILYWNPILHVVEWYRTGLYIDYVPLLDMRFPIGFAAITLVLGLIVERVYRLRISIS